MIAYCAIAFLYIKTPYYHLRLLWHNVLVYKIN